MILSSLAQSRASVETQFGNAQVLAMLRIKVGVCSARPDGPPRCLDGTIRRPLRRGNHRLQKCQIRSSNDSAHGTPAADDLSYHKTDHNSTHQHSPPVAVNASDEGNNNSAREEVQQTPNNNTSEVLLEENEEEDSLIKSKKESFFTSSSLPHVPWDIGTTITVMTIWLIAFFIAAYDVVPFLLRVLGHDSTASSARPAIHALRHLLLDITQLTMTLALLHRALSTHKPRSLGLFAVKFFPLGNWVPTAIAGVATFPVIDFLYKQMVTLFATAHAAAAAAPSDTVAFASYTSWEVKAIWFLVLAVCAPLWEEIMFRGFLLPSFGRYLAPGWAIAASSLVFATVHFTKEGFVPLLLLGGVFGAVYVKTLNLLPAVILHSFWNILLLAQIFMNGG